MTHCCRLESTVSRVWPNSGITEHCWGEASSDNGGKAVKEDGQDVLGRKRAAAQIGFLGFAFFKTHCVL